MAESYANDQPERMRESYFATKPTGFTRFMRTFLPWQMWRFAMINLKMILIIFKSHG
jgi:hypothetical protein